MFFLSIDVGIKNLAVCLFSIRRSPDPLPPNLELELVRWDVIDLSSECAAAKCHIETCKTAPVFQKHATLYCRKHSKASGYVPGPAGLTPARLNRKKAPGLWALAGECGLDVPATAKKADLVTALTAHRHQRCLDPVAPRVNASKMDLSEVGKNLKRKLGQMFSEYDIAHVAIENQIGPLAIRMKTIQGMLMQYFIMVSDHVVVHSVSSSRKLTVAVAVPAEIEQEADGGSPPINSKGSSKKGYVERKKLGVARCRAYLADYSAQWTDHFNAHKKKDDLADAFLQGVWVIQNVPGVVGDGL